MNLTNPMNRKNTKECEIYFSKLEKIKENVAAKVKKMEMIPDEWMEEYKLIFLLEWGINRMHFNLWKNIKLEF